jgi:H+-transporting ATPase
MKSEMITGVAQPKNTNTRPKSNQVDFGKLTLNELEKELSASMKGLDQAEAERRLGIYGFNTIEERRMNPILKFLSYFWGPIPWMIEIAAILSAAVQHWEDLIIICVLLLFNAVVGFWQEYQAANAVEDLKRQLALKARVLRDGKWKEIDAKTLVPGDVVRLRLGDIIPADVKLAEGDYLSVDQSALTGESLPVNKKIEDVAYSGSVAKQGEMVALVIATGAETYFGRTARLVSTAKSESHFQHAVLTIGDYLIYISLILAGILILVLIYRGAEVFTLFQFALILIVAAIPVAMPAVLSVTMAVGAKDLAKMKAIVTRLESIEEMAGMDILCSDKTGTLTQNQLTLGDPVVFEGQSPQQVILVGALASKEEDRDAIDLAVLAGLKEPQSLSKFEQLEFVPFDPIHKRTTAKVRSENGDILYVTKGAPQVIMRLCDPPDAVAKEIDASVNAFALKGYRTLGVARSDDGQHWKFLGILPLYDPPREDSAETIQRAGEYGVQVKMITGDNLAIAKQISRQLGMNPDIKLASEFLEDDTGHALSRKKMEQLEAASGFDEVFPEHKYEIVRIFQDRGHIVGMTGDGVNDAPALKQADMGIAVSDATDAARSASDLVLTAPGLSVIVKAVEEARRIFERMNSYAIYRITETIRIMIFVVLAMTIFNFYPITAIMIILLALLNDLPIMTIAYDNTWLEPKPVRWDMRRVLVTSTILGIIGVVQTFGMLVIGKVVLNFDTAQIQSLIYLKLAVAGHLTLLVVRNRKSFLSKPYPAPILLIAILITQAIAVVFVGFGILVAPLPWTIIGFVWVYCLIWMFINDFVKQQIYQHLNHSGSHHGGFISRLQQPLHPHGNAGN